MINKVRSPSLTKTSKKSPILNVNVGGGMNCIGSLASSPTHPGDPPSHVSDRKKEKNESNGPGTAVKRSVKEQGNTLRTLVHSVTR